MLSKHPAQPSRTLAGTILKDNRDSLHLFPHTDMHRFTASFARLQLVSSFPQQRNLYWNLSETICSRGEKKMLCGKYLAICLCLDFTKFENYCLQLLCFHKTEEKTGGGISLPGHEVPPSSLSICLPTLPGANYPNPMNPECRLVACASVPGC